MSDRGHQVGSSFLLCMCSILFGVGVTIMLMGLFLSTEEPKPCPVCSRADALATVLDEERGHAVAAEAELALVRWQMGVVLDTCPGRDRPPMWAKEED